MKFSFLISLVLWIVLFVAVALLYYALSSLGVFDALQRTLASVTSSQTSAGVDLTKWTSATRVLGYTMLLGAVDVVLITAIVHRGRGRLQPGDPPRRRDRGHPQGDRIARHSHGCGNLSRRRAPAGPGSRAAGTADRGAIAQPVRALP